MAEAAWAPEGIDYTKPSPARVYDVHLGGFHNFAADRAAAEQVRAYMPQIPLILRANRAFLRRAVQYVVSQGITQFLDLGSGIPTVGNVHEVAQAADPRCRVAYVDIDPVAVAHGREILSDNPTAVAVQGDLRDWLGVLGNPQVRELLDFTRPVAVLMVAVLHFIDDADDPAGIVRGYREAMAEGSYLVFSHASLEGEQAGAVEATQEYTKRVADFYMRGRAQLSALLKDFELVEPGLVYLTQWRPDSPEDVGDDPSWTSTYAAVGRLGRPPS
jgi:SAM-dependent methyltransferase